MKNILNRFLLYLDKQLEKKNLEIIKKIFGNNLKIVIDVGAHHGETIDFFNNNFSVEQIYSFEPNPEAVEILKKKISQNTKVYEYALSNIEGNSNLKIGFLSSMSTMNEINSNSLYSKLKKIIIALFYRKLDIYKKTIIIKTIRLDQFLIKEKIEQIDILKIDTEGFELNVLKGIGDKVKKVKLILCEHHYDNSIIKNYNFSEINEYLVLQDFVLLSKFKMQLRKGYELIYINNKFNN